MKPTPWLAGAAATTTAAAWLARAIVSPSSQAFGPVVTRLPTPGNAVALTFDDGPSPVHTPQILDILESFHARATFFVIGRYALEHPALVARAAAAGHAVANHTFDHHYLGAARGRRYWQDQLQRTNDAIAAATGQRPALFRPPMGFKTRHQARAVRELNMRTVTWTRRAFDTRPVPASVIARRLLKNLAPGDILTLHDGLDPHRRNASQQQTVEALPGILAALRERSMDCVSLE